MLHVPFNLDAGLLAGVPVVERRLADLRGIFHDEPAFERMLVEQENPLVYTVQTVEPGEGEGDLHYGLGTIMPGCVGDEYFMTRGHLHAWRPAAEVYVGLGGSGLMVMESERGESTVAPIGRGHIVTVPGNTAHRTVNTGAEPLRYLGIYPARAGHDYASIAERNFRVVVLERGGEVAVVERAGVR